jgi:hypothetical protein
MIKARKIDNLKHRELKNGDRVEFYDCSQWDITNYVNEDGIICYLLRKVLKSGKLGKTNISVTYSWSGLTTKNHKR